MTYQSWAEDNAKKVKAIRNKLEKRGLSPSEVIDYFDYDNMREKEPNHCGLYKDNIKCHDMENLNCYLCACPHFISNDNFPYKEEKNLKYYSKCKINSRFAKDFVYNNDVHCDCAGCTIPHLKGTALKYYGKELATPPEDSVSILDLIRGWQLSDILGKFKLF